MEFIEAYEGLLDLNFFSQIHNNGKMDIIGYFVLSYIFIVALYGVSKCEIKCQWV